MKQTAVQWLIEQLENNLNGFSIAWKEEFQQALQMEREQIEEAFNEGACHGVDVGAGRRPEQSDGSQYYSKTFKNKL